MATDREFQTDVIDRLARIETHITGMVSKNEDIETRLRSQERRQWVVVAAILALASPFLSKLGIYPSSLL